ncbi:hypothetical protein [Viridibacterium curvum]|uniref:Lipoprotein n=1 Tax=Viridibacterium curvum TaxID=1101404 RepID=A0ABP9QN79_9RHOO
MIRILSLAALISLTACSQEEPRESDYANSTTGMVPGAAASIQKDLSQAAAEDVQSAAQAEVAESAAKDVTSVAQDIAKASRQPAGGVSNSESR